ncbi:FliA/WhiG family RNA polymerase sigma factor [Arthrobacter sp. TPD3018]|uniref:sigma-70 family RNA polymerase sigma factor n=1 Tax=Bacteria TaxID=2 RepID=UPI000D5164D6|nr:MULTISPECIES: RNA polymerase sigma factor FliA [Bacteria]PVE51672.1 FliA/WhiG family RNA polymerase sigma factor [Sphingomonas sp. TPD3009]PVE52606.1 FliA/WhiG family RNA polymerase sigma factor [Arthrobacter sp. TPD3018]PVE80733.1 FliA/WhiG family RNA polymerase sigma factor [Sphingomonas melonis]
MSAEPMSGAFAGAQPAPQGMVPSGPLTYSRATRPGGNTEALIRQHLPLVRRIAWHVHGSMSTIVDVEDLVQIGLVALVEAVGQAAEQGAQFRAYLQTRLRGAMIDELRRQATTTRGAMRRRRQYQAAIATVTARTGRAADEATIAAELGVTIERLRAEYETADTVRFESMDEVYADDLPWFADDTPDAFEQLAESDLRDTLIAAIGALPEREALVIQLYYVEELNLEEIGQVLGVGSARVCQIKAAAHAKLKKALARKV